jgi:hypothetical protein
LYFQLAVKMPSTAETESGSLPGMWGTPTANDAKDSQYAYSRGDKTKPVLKLPGQVQMWPTPTANEDAAGTPNGKMQRMLGNHLEVRNTGQGSLNPDWVEALMGYPQGWTSLDDGETDPGKTESPE